MPKTTAQELKDAGLIPEMFQNQTAATFDAFLAAVIAEQADILEGRIGAARYADAVKPMATYIKRAEKGLVLAELWDRRINKKLAQAISSDQQTSCKYEESQRDKWQKTADQLIEQKIMVDATTDGSGDFASGVVVTEHFSV